MATQELHDHVLSIEDLLGGTSQKAKPGTVFLVNTFIGGTIENPYVALYSCPRCGTLGLITRRQLYDTDWMICASGQCSAEHRIYNKNVSYRPPQ